MADVSITTSCKGNADSRRHRFAHILAVSLLAAALAGCAGTPQGDAAVRSARSAYASEDYSEAAQLLAEPAMKGDPEAQYALGYLLYYGKGVPKDQRRARLWFEDAARLGHPGAQQALQVLKVYSQLPPLPGERAPLPEDESDADDSRPGRGVPQDTASPAAHEAVPQVENTSATTSPQTAPASRTEELPEPAQSLPEPEPAPGEVSPPREPDPLD